MMFTILGTMFYFTDFIDVLHVITYTFISMKYTF